MESEFKESSNSIRIELNRFVKAGLLESKTEGNKRFFKANVKHPLYNDIHSILLKYVGFDQIIDKVLERLGNLDSAYIIGAFAKGMDSKVIELILVGNEIEKEYLIRLICKAEKVAKRKIRYILLNPLEESEVIKDYPDALLLWKAR